MATDAWKDAWGRSWGGAWGHAGAPTAHQDAWGGAFGTAWGGAWGHVPSTGLPSVLYSAPRPRNAFVITGPPRKPPEFTD